MASTSTDNVIVEKKMRKAKTSKVDVPVLEVSSSNVDTRKDEHIDNIVNQLSELVNRLAILEKEVKELKQQQGVSSSQPTQIITKKEEKEKKTRVPTAYNNFMKTKMLELKETHPNLTNIERMKMAAEAWSESKKS